MVSPPGPGRSVTPGCLDDPTVLERETPVHSAPASAPRTGRTPAVGASAGAVGTLPTGPSSHRGGPADPSPSWRTLADGRANVERRPLPRMGRTITAFVAASAVALIGVLVFGWVVSRNAALDEALADARSEADLIAITVLQPALEVGLLEEDQAAIDAVDETVQTLIETENLVRVKLWTAEGRIVYSDEERLIGKVFPLNEEQLQVLDGDEVVISGLSDLVDTENRFERSSQDRLLEVYRRVSLPDGTPLLFETYSPYAEVAARGQSIMRSFVPITIGTVLLLVVCLLPLVWSLVHRLRRSQRSRERLLRRAIDASTAERRRIAGNVHDSVVQGLAGASFVIAGAVDAVERDGQPKVAGELRDAASGVRESIRGLRSMLVEIYPPSVSVAGLAVALQDLVAPLRAQGIDATADTPATVELPRDLEALVFRVSQEALRNVAQHSGAATATLTLTVTDTLVRLVIADDGAGLDVDAALGRRDGHVGMQVLRDLAEDAGALLQIASAPGAGTTIRLEVETR